MPNGIPRKKKGKVVRKKVKKKKVRKRT